MLLRKMLSIIRIADGRTFEMAANIDADRSFLNYLIAELALAGGEL